MKYNITLPVNWLPVRLLVTHTIMVNKLLSKINLYSANMSEESVELKFDQSHRHRLPIIFSLEFPPSSYQIYRFLNCLQIQSKNSPFLWCKHLWPLAISIHVPLIGHINHVDFCILKLYYAMLYDNSIPLT